MVEKGRVDVEPAVELVVAAAVEVAAAVAAVVMTMVVVEALGAQLLSLVEVAAARSNSPELHAAGPKRHDC